METPRSSAAKGSKKAEETPVSSVISPDVIVWDKKPSSPVLSAIRPSNDRRDFLSLFASSPSDKNVGASPVSTRSPHLTLPSLRRGPNGKRQTSRRKATTEVTDMKTLLESPQSTESPTPTRRRSQPSVREPHDDFLTTMMPLEEDDELGQLMDDFESSQQPVQSSLEDDFDCDDFDEESLCKACDDVERTLYSKP